MIDGKHILNTVRIGDDDYSLVCCKITEIGFPQWFVWVCKGNPQVATPDLIAETGLNVTGQPDPVEGVARMKKALNEQLAKYFSIAPPVGWEAIMDSMIEALILVCTDNQLTVN